MAILKCKMCGGDIELSADRSFGTCDSCGSTMTLPKINDEQRANLFNRGNHFRRSGNFDKALSVYESIVAEENGDAEAHWCVALCRYGIEYVEDPTSHERVPTCHRASYELILNDVDYLAALEYSDGYTRSLYEAEADKIATLQRGILSISQQEEPFDVFICYKESTDGGSRTKDSALAQDIYYQLTQAGYKVFFSRITLEDKLGHEYEPYIFAALNSAKVMVVVGTEQEHFSAVWVKNEWSRFLALMKKDKNRLLIPCYREMDPYNLPDELSMLQSQDMSKIGFAQDLVRGIKKVLDAGKAPAPAVVPAVSVSSTAMPGVESLLKRGMLFLEDSDWASANEYFDRVLDIDPEYARAYAGKLCAERQVNNEAALADGLDLLAGKNNYEKALRFADTGYGATIAGYNQTIADRIDEQHRAQLYERAKAHMTLAQKSDLSSHTDKEGGYHVTAEYFRPIIDMYCNAAGEFRNISGYLDADALAAECDDLAEQAKVYANQIAEEKRLKDEQVRLEREHQAELDRIVQVKKKKLIIIIASLVIIVVAAIVLWTTVISPALDYSGATALAEAGEYEEAITAFAALGNYKDAAEQIHSISLTHAEQLAEAGEYDAAIAAVAALGDDKDAAEQLRSIDLTRAKQLAEASEYEAAITAFAALGDYKDAAEQLRGTSLAHAEQLAAAGEDIAAMQMCFQVGERNLALQYCDPAKLLSTNATHTVGIQSDGTVVTAGNTEDHECDVDDWSDIVAISAGKLHTVGLRSDGTVAAVGNNNDGQCDVSGWSDIVTISTGDYHTVGLRSDGTVVSVGSGDYGQRDVDYWADIAAMSAGELHTVGLRSDGTVVAAGSNRDGQCNVGDWTGIVAVSVGYDRTVGLRSDGTVIATGNNEDGQCNMSDWTDIVAVSAGRYHTVGLRSDGTVVAAGSNRSGQCNVGNWTDIVAVSAGFFHAVGLRSDGTVIAAGSNSYGQCGVGSWDLW